MRGSGGGSLLAAAGLDGAEADPADATQDVVPADWQQCEQTVCPWRTLSRQAGRDPSSNIDIQTDGFDT